MKKESAEKTHEPVESIALDTLSKNKQALIFFNSKPRTEKNAEEIANKTKINDEKKVLLDEMKKEILGVLSTPTKQCIRLSKCVEKGIAFHHSGLAEKQKKLIEKWFREGKIKIICCTPTLAAGVDLPAFRSVVADSKRFSEMIGMSSISVLEYEQMSGRAGRPGKDPWGESILIAKTEKEKEFLTDRYIYGIPEPIYSKLAVEPILRTHVLSLIATGIVRTKNELMDFFKKTFWAKQYMDLEEIERIIDSVIDLLEGLEFVKANSKKTDFVNAGEMKKSRKNNEDITLEATELGMRVSQLYLDPLSAKEILEKISSEKKDSFYYIMLVCSLNEMKPKIRAISRNKSWLFEMLENDEEANSFFNDEYYISEEDFLDSLNTALVLNDWVEEKTEEHIMEKFKAEPGILKYKIDLADWLLYACEEISKIKGFYKNINEVEKIRLRLKYGIKEELLPLIKLKNIGRVRARKLFSNGIKNLGDIKKADNSKLAGIIGRKIAAEIKEEVGQETFNENLSYFS